VRVATIEIELSKYAAKKVIAIVMNGATFNEASEIDYLMTNVDGSTATGEWIVKTYEIDYLMTNVDGLTATGEWIVKTYSKRNLSEVFYREAKGWLRLSCCAFK
jgi:hypothetical protein